VKHPFRAVSAATLAVLILTACGEEEPATQAGPEQTALRMFELAQDKQPSEQLISELFGAGLDERERVALLEALSALAEPSALEATGSEQLEGLNRVVVDIAAALPAGGEARYSVQLEQTAQGEWRILWFQGPGLAWPSKARPRGDGLTTSAGPDGDGAP
jgi:hypothetical protein